MSTEQSEPPVDIRIILGGLALVALAALAVVFDPIELATTGAEFAYMAFLAVLVSVVVSIIIMIVGGLLLGLILGIGRLFGFADE